MVWRKGGSAGNGLGTNAPLRLDRPARLPISERRIERLIDGVELFIVENAV